MGCNKKLYKISGKLYLSKSIKKDLWVSIRCVCPFINLIYFRFWSVAVLPDEDGSDANISHGADGGPSLSQALDL